MSNLPERHEVRYFGSRADHRGSEPGFKESRPWAVLSDAESHKLGLVIATAVISAPRPGSTHDYLVEAGSRNGSLWSTARIDVQQLWTYLDSQQLPLRSPPDVLDELTIERLRARLTERLSSTSGMAGGAAASYRPRPGTVVWAELLEGASAIDSDLDATSHLLGKVGIEWPVQSRMLPCVCVASTEIEEAKGEVVLPLVAAVPLIHAPKLQDEFPENPTVVVPGTDAILGAPVHLSALTQVLFTLDYRRSSRRIQFRHGDVRGWTATDTELGAILEDVRDFIGLAP